MVHPDPSDATPSLESIGQLIVSGKDAYWKRKDLPTAVSHLESAIDQAKAQSSRSADPDGVARFLSLAKTAAYDLASFTWPGWEEPGVTVTPADLAAGRDAAALNLQLAIQLNRPVGPLANAHWLVGAHHLSAADYDAALRSFSDYGAVAPTDDHRHLADGYAAVTLLAAGRDVANAGVRFDAAVAGLRAVDTEDGRFFADQLIGVRRHFVGL